MDLRLEVRAEAGWVVVKVGGEIDVYTAPRLREELVELVYDGRYLLVIDLQDVDFLDSTGLGVLVGGLKRVRAHEGSLRLVCTRERILKIFRITGLSKVFPISETVEAAISAAVGANPGLADLEWHDEYLPVSVYLSEERGHPVVESAIAEFLALAGYAVVGEDVPEPGSWFVSKRAAIRRAVTSDSAKEMVKTAAHAADARLVGVTDAELTSTYLQSLAPVLTAVASYKQAVIRMGAVLIVKDGDHVSVQQLTAGQQLILDHQPDLLRAPQQILEAIGATPAQHTIG